MGKKVMKTMDGNTAAAYVSYAFTDVAAIYPITPSSNMAESVDEWASSGKKNIFGRPVAVSELQSEAGAAGAVHGSLQAGALTTTFTASQGLLLMIPNMYKIAGELLPGVFHVSARAIAGHALSIFGDHSDVMAAKQTGFAFLASGSVQEVMDLAGVAHLSAIKGRVPFVHFFDGFRTSHEVQKIETIDYAEFDRLVDHEAINAFRNGALSPEHPVTRGTAQNPDIFFQAREASNKYYLALPEIVVNYMNEINKITGRDYKPFNYYGAPDAENIIIAMGSATEAIEETIDYLAKQGEKVGLIKVRLYRPWASKYFFDVLPATVKKIAVLDRCKEPGADGEPLYKDVRAMFYGKENAPIIVGGRYGLGSKDTTPTHVKRVYDELKKATPANDFTLGIVDDVTNLSLNIEEQIVAETEGTIRCKFWGLGSDGTVGANKSAIKIIGDKTDLYAQGYFSYDSKKSGGITVSHLRFGKNVIRSTYLIDEADYVACHNQSYVHQYDLLKGLKKGGTFVLNCKWNSEELNALLPAAMKRYMAKNAIKFYTIDGTGIAEEIGLGNRINMIMQSAFFKLAEVIDLDEAVKYLKEAIEKSYGNKGAKIVDLNNKAVDLGIERILKVEIPADWANAADSTGVEAKGEPSFITNILRPINAQKGDDLPVSTFNGYEDGTFEHGTAAFEKRGIAVNVPEWQIDNCIQCNQCSYVCPHAVIRPFLLTEEEMKNAPASFNTKAAIGKGLEGLQYKIQVSPLDCTGCGNCAEVCPAKQKALIMKPLDTQVEVQGTNWNFVSELPVKSDKMPLNTVKGSQFAQPLFEFSGACAGCGETPYIKAVTQLYGDRMMIANATGCSSIWGGSAPSTPYTKNAEGKGPAWANSLFEDNAEYGYGMNLGVKAIRAAMVDKFEALVAMNVDPAVTATFTEWLETRDDAEGSKAASAKVLEVLANNNVTDTAAKEILTYAFNQKDYLVKRSVWILGGDGWAYDIGFGGLDHVIASGENVNILVFDTEVYSNTGGQASKATPVGAIAKFASSGMKVKKKDLGMIATTYGYVYVAQVAMGANQNQFLKVIQEAESYDGPSLIIAYAPCINHGIRTGMGTTQRRTKEAVESGYWHLWRFDPRVKAEGKNPFFLDSKEPTASFREFLLGETRYTTLQKQFPEAAEELFSLAEEQSKDRYNGYVRMTKMEF
jgi:pyruvate-ferredoxin/flavodoxin oxidoreductase